MQLFSRLFVFCFGLLVSVLSPLASAEPVRVLYFHKPTCHSCYQVSVKILRPLKETHGDQLKIIGVDTLTDAGLIFYRSTAEEFAIAKSRQHVPMLILGDDVLVGRKEIEAQIEDVFEKYAERGGVDWSTKPPDQFEEITLKWLQEVVPLKKLPFWLRVRHHPVENGLAIAILLLMIVVAARSTIQLVRTSRNPLAVSFDRMPRIRTVLLGVLSLIGLAIAAYLSFIHEMQREAVCFVVGDCNAVLHSEYAFLFGVPVSFIGLSTFLAIIAAVVFSAIPKFSPVMTATLFGMAYLSTLGFIYLTFLEPFVIGAICSWCLTSAVTMTLMLVIATRPGLEAISMLHRSATEPQDNESEETTCDPS